MLDFLVVAKWRYFKLLIYLYIISGLQTSCEALRGVCCFSDDFFFLIIQIEKYFISYQNTFCFDRESEVNDSRWLCPSSSKSVQVQSGRRKKYRSSNQSRVGIVCVFASQANHQVFEIQSPRNKLVQSIRHRRGVYFNEVTPSEKTNVNGHLRSNTICATIRARRTDISLIVFG